MVCTSSGFRAEGGVLARVSVVLMVTSAKGSFGGWLGVYNGLVWRSLLGPNVVTLFLGVGATGYG